MALQKATTYNFVGESIVDQGISSMLDQAGFTRVGTSEADVVFTYCLTISALEDLYYDSNGILQTAKKDAVLVDLSPSTVSFARELYAMASVNDCTALDAPLVIHNVVAQEAFSQPYNIGVVVGGNEEAFSRVEPLFRSFAQRVMWMGKAGCGQSAKIALSLTSAASLVGVVEAYASLVASEAQIDQDDYMDLVSAFGTFTPNQEAFLEAIYTGDFKTSSFTVEYMMAELAAALTSVDDRDLILPQAESGFRLMELLAMVGGVDYSPAALCLVFADEEASKKYGLDWSRAEGAYEHDEDSDHDHDGHHHDCGCSHEDVYDDDDYHQGSSFMGFSSN